MNKLIKEAESLYKQIDKAQVHLINARLNNDEEGKKSTISEIETAMCNAMQVLKCFIERKDNIVDLSEVWHEYNPKQEICDEIIACYKRLTYCDMRRSIDFHMLSICNHCCRQEQ